MSKSVLNSSFLKKTDVPPYEISQRQEKIKRRVRIQLKID
jgi:hypothetical protein